jgi:succinoglycan biosynthesis protein ExoA
VIVPVRNEASFICQTLGRLLGQQYDPERFEVLVADGQSTDQTPVIVRHLERRHGNLRLLSNPKRWSSAGRNVALRAARGDIVVIIDGHCELEDRDYLRRLAEAFARSGAACIGRPQPLDVTGAAPLQRAIAAARASRLGHHPDSHIYSATEGYVRPQSVAVAYRREVFETLGLFDESFDACEDVEFNHRLDRAGLLCYFTPKVAVRYHPRSSLGSLFRQMVRYGRGRVRLLRKHPETFSAPGFLPAAFLLGVVAGPAFAWLSPWLALAYAGSLGLYALVVGLASLVLTLKARDLRLLPWLPLAFATIHAGAGAGVLQEWIVGLRRKPAAAPVAKLPERLPRRRAA